MIEAAPIFTIAMISIFVYLFALMVHRAVRYGGAVGVLHGANAELVGRTVWDSKYARMGVSVHRLRVKGKDERDVVLELMVANSSTPLAIPREHARQVVALLQEALG